MAVDFANIADVDVGFSSSPSTFSQVYHFFCARVVLRLRVISFMAVVEITRNSLPSPENGTAA